MRNIVITLIFIGCSLARADHVTLDTGHVYEGQILQDNDEDITFRLDHGVIVLSKSMIKSIDHIPPALPEKPADPVGPKTGLPAPAVLLPTWEKVTTELARQPWATNLKEIPATVIDKGEMRYVPYSSYRCGTDYEVNIYGDPDAPAGVEIGVYRDLLQNEAAKQQCVDFVAGLLNDKLDGSIARILDKRKDLRTRNGLTIEITPPSAEDAYGGWWISVYDLKALDSARATPPEVEKITVTKASLAPRTEVAENIDPATQVVAPPPMITDWSPQDVRYARPSRLYEADGGRVYVRGYRRVEGRYTVSTPHPGPARGGRRK